MAKKRNASYKHSMSLAKQYAVGLFVLVSVLIFSFLYILEASAKPFLEGQQHAEQIAVDYAGVTSIASVARYTGETSYYSVSGKNQSGEDILVLIPESSSDILVYKAVDGISQEEAKATAKENGAGKITKVTFGYAKNQPIWEVKSGQAYYIISFENGTFLSKEGI
ncbi:cell wall elongation regulator TseB-like domain-containing protein [Streptococcus handemini]|uniref:cell wall elongation regulator TseB-like domain-containing protein n=1 Tax=Streptococcus handemini TaxID=3161188 RepID=UPI0034D5C023